VVLKEQLKLLVELQEIDSYILSIDEKIESYQARLDQFKIPLNQAQEAFQKFKAKSESLDKKKKAKELELDEIEDKINKLKGRSSEIKTNKEYEAHLKEIVSFEKSKYRTEDEILAIMEDYEIFSGEVKKEEVKVRETEAEFKKQEKVMDEEKNQLQSELEKLKARRKDFSSRLDKEIYDQYSQLLQRMGGLAVVQTVNETCLGCNTNIPPQLFNDIKAIEDFYSSKSPPRLMKKLQISKSLLDARQ
jgi:predicted  nucleic acid-binding Zn-ribbon protein